MYTKGDWKVYGQHVHLNTDNTSDEIVTVLCPRWMDKEEAKANAHLIASSPDLYEALEFLVDFVEMPVDEYLDKYGAGITSKQACDKARKAIAKAEINL